MAERALSLVVLDEDFRDRFQELVTAHDDEAVQRALSTVSTNLCPLNMTDRELKGETARKIDTALRPIGAKVSPHLSPAQASAWRDAMVLALSDLPGRIALEATRKAVHVPFTALWEVEKTIREIGDGVVQMQKTALFRLEQMLDAIKRAQIPQPQLESPEKRVWTQAEIDEANAIFRRVRASTRYRLGEDGTCVAFELEPANPARRKTKETAEAAVS